MEQIIAKGSLLVSDLYTLLRPQPCDLRVYLSEKNTIKRETSPYEEVIRRLGEYHEKSHLATLGDEIEIPSGSLELRAGQTKDAIQNHAKVIYQGVFQAEYEFNGTKCVITGIPDFLIFEDNNYIVRDSKIARRINEKDHPEIIYSLQMYGWLFEQSVGHAPLRLEVHSGTNDLIPIFYDGEIENALKILQKIVSLKSLVEEPYDPVGWTKCGCCDFNEYCWGKAKASLDPAILIGVDQGLAKQLHLEGVVSVPQMLDRFDETSLTEFKYPWGTKSRKVGKTAEKILSCADAFQKEKEVWLSSPQIPQAKIYVMFDLEGLPPQLDEIGKIYLWGFQVFGESPGEFQYALAGFGPEGDSEGWSTFLKKTNEIFERFGDVSFVHWHHYERVNILEYVKRYGDPDGVAAKVLRNLLDLLPIAQKSVILPLPSYSLKVIEKYVGFKRSQEEYGGDWAMAKYIEATEMENEEERNSVMEDILKYNREDLEATWAVFQWLKKGGHK